MPRTRSRRLAITAGLATLAALAAGVLAAASPAQALTKPTAVVSLGDSFISGEGAGSYEPGSDEPGDFCHRSQVSEIHRTAIAGVSTTINLACSGAKTENVALGGVAQNGEAPQAERLRTVAADYDVKLVVLTIGANDVGFTPLVLDCIKAYFLIGDRCQDIWNPTLPGKMSATGAKIAANLADIRTVMRDAGYSDSSYQLVLQSYSSPVTELNRYSWDKAFQGCPVRDDDAGWARATVVGQYSSMMGGVAAQSGVRFLDLGPALRGHEVCAEGVSHSQEWANGVKIDIEEIENGLGENIVQQSFHPNALGHGQLGGCLTEFYSYGSTNAACTVGGDGNLHPTAASVAAG